MFVSADRGGAWRAVLPAAARVRLLGLSMVEAGRTVQAEGYLAVTPQGLAAQLRAGAGALVMSRPGGVTRILAVDFDRKGGTVVSGVGTPKAGVNLRTDGVQRGQTTVNAAGQFALALNEPLAPGDHDVAVANAGVRDQIRVTVSPAAPLTGGPFAAARTPEGWRIDWMTPAGGVQTTVLIAAPEPAA